MLGRDEEKGPTTGEALEVLGGRLSRAISALGWDGRFDYSLIVGRPLDDDRTECSASTCIDASRGELNAGPTTLTLLCSAAVAAIAKTTDPAGALESMIEALREGVAEELRELGPR